MSDQKRLPVGETLREVARELAASVLAIIMLIPLVFIWVADRLTVRWFTKRGGLR